ncbi:MAG: dicarboxylate/amino acid:cation symporter [Pseudohongiellaceae bacterium]
MSLSTRILLGLSLGLVTGILYSVQGGELLIFLPALIETVGTLWVNTIRMTVVPLLMALLVTSIADQQEGGVVAETGGKTIGLFVMMIGGVCLYTLILAPPLISLLNIDQAAATGLLEDSNSVTVAAGELPRFQDWLVNLIPTNPFRAAVDADMLPLLIFTAIFSVALTKIDGSKSKIIVEFFAAVRDTMLVLIGWIMQLAPIGIFALVFPLAATMGLSAISTLASFIVIVCSLIVVLMLLLYPIAVVFGRVPLGAFARAVASVQVIGFSTRSSLASLPATMAVTEALGISRKVSGLVLPIAVTLFKFASPVARTTGTYFIAALYGIELGPTELVVIALTIGLFSFYTPGIPSGGLLIMAPVYISLGLPVEGIGILIAVDLIVDMFLTAANVTANVTVAAILSREDRSK